MRTAVIALINGFAGGAVGWFVYDATLLTHTLPPPPCPQPSPLGQVAASCYGAIIQTVRAPEDPMMLSVFVLIGALVGADLSLVVPRVLDRLGAPGPLIG